MPCNRDLDAILTLLTLVKTYDQPEAHFYYLKTRTEVRTLGLWRGLYLVSAPTPLPVFIY